MIEAAYSQVETAQGDFQLLTGIETIINSYTNLLSIRRGSYPFSPDMGTDIYKYIFDFLDDYSVELIEQELKTTLQQENRAIIQSINVTMDPIFSTIYAQVTVSIINTAKYSITINLNKNLSTITGYQLV